MKTIKNTAVLFFVTMIFFWSILAEEVKQHDVTIEQYFNNLEIEQQKAYEEWKKAYRYNSRSENLSSLCEARENSLMSVRIQAYKQNLLKSNIQVSKEEYADFLKSVGYPEDLVDWEANLHAKRGTGAIVQKENSFLGKFWFVSVGFAALCLIINDIKKSWAEKRMQKQKK